MVRASLSSFAPVTVQCAMRCAPSPSRTICNARSSQTASIAEPTRITSSSVRTPAQAPLASNATVSDVEVQPSTVMQLKVLSTATRSACSVCRESSGASVVTTAIIVPRSGRIMPAPFAIPPTRMFPIEVAISRSACFGAASVVVIATAASAPPPSCRPAKARSMPCSTISIGSCTPITPVEATSTCSVSQPSPAATSTVMRSASRRPGSPVAALALPLEITIARVVPRAM